MDVSSEPVLVLGDLFSTAILLAVSAAADNDLRQDLNFNPSRKGIFLFIEGW